MHHYGRPNLLRGCKQLIRASAMTPFQCHERVAGPVQMRRCIDTALLIHKELSHHQTLTAEGEGSAPQDRHRPSHHLPRPPHHLSQHRCSRGAGARSWPLSGPWHWPAGACSAQSCRQNATSVRHLLHGADRLTRGPADICSGGEGLQLQPCRQRELDTNSCGRASQKAVVAGL